MFANLRDALHPHVDTVGQCYARLGLAILMPTEWPRRCRKSANLPIGLAIVPLILNRQ
jgi:hypothetical protein